MNDVDNRRSRSRIGIVALMSSTYAALVALRR